MKNLALQHPLVVALGSCFYGLPGPSHSVVDRYYTRLNVPPHINPAGSNKADRIEALLHWVAENCPDRALDVVGWMIFDLHYGGHLDPTLEDRYVGESVAGALRMQLERQGFAITDDGELAVKTSFGVGGIPATRAQVRSELARLQRSSEDPAALIGHAKDLIETVAKTVLHESGKVVDDKLEFPALLKTAGQALPLMPGGVDPDSRTGKALTRYFAGLWQMANSLNELRNAAGIGHGRIVSPEFDAALARTVVQGALALPLLWLDLLDQRDETG